MAALYYVGMLPLSLAAAIGLSIHSLINRPRTSRVLPLSMLVAASGVTVFVVETGVNPVRLLW